MVPHGCPPGKGSLPQARVSFPLERVSFPQVRVSFPLERVSFPLRRVNLLAMEKSNLYFYTGLALDRVNNAPAVGFDAPADSVKYIRGVIRVAGPMDKMVWTIMKSHENESENQVLPVEHGEEVEENVCDDHGEEILSILPMVFTRDTFNDLTMDSFNPDFKYLSTFDDPYVRESSTDFNRDRNKDLNSIGSNINILESSSWKDGVFYLEYPVDSFNCPICPQILPTFGKWAKHINVVHKSKAIRVVCSKCGKSSQYHNIACHYPKCIPKKADTPMKSHTCSVCGLGFHTRSGLSQHCRHRHPAVRNEQRKEDMAAKSKIKEGSTRSRIWTKDEVAQLIQLERKYIGKRNINKCIESEMRTKTNKQISDKRRELAKKKLVVTGDREEVTEVEDIRVNILEIPPPRERIFPLKGHPEVDLVEKICKRGKQSREGREIINSLGEIEGLLKEDLTKALGWAMLEKLCYSLVEGQDPRNESQIELRNKGKGKIRKEGRRKQFNAIRRYATKKAKYKFYQQLFDKDRRRLTRIIMGEPDKAKCAIPMKEIEEYYVNILGTIGHGNMIGWPSSTENADNDILMSPISVNEIRIALTEIRKDSAPGPDKVKVSNLWDIFNLDSLILTKIFNIWFLNRQVPDEFKKNRTILIPKTQDEEEMKKLTSWRPLTIGSVWIRIYTKILAKRLVETVKICSRQKGFISAPGCEENIAILDNLIKGAKRNGNEIAIVFVDLAKAFDSVGHGHIIAGLRRFGIDEHFIDIIRDLYDNCTTRVWVGDEATESILIRRGVKQGDPLSPILFNIAMDPLLTRLEVEGSGFYVKGNSVTSLAFADDVAILSSSYKGMIKNLGILEEFCKNTNLSVNVKKTKGFHILTKHKTYVVNPKDNWQIGSEKIEYVQPGDFEKYLGARIDPWIGVGGPVLKEKLKDWSENLIKAPLKPAQKILILQTYILPKLFYNLLLIEPPFNLLEDLDVLVRKIVKEILHLPQCTTDGIFYSRGRDGGLALTKFSVQIPNMLIRKWRRHIVSRDDWMDLSYLYAGENLVDKILSFSAVTSHPKKWREEEFLRWSELRCQGIGIKYFKNDLISNSIFRNSSKVKSSAYIAALQLRANIYPTRETLARGRGGVNALCRWCSKVRETVPHISGQCYKTKNARIKRHNRVVSAVVDKVGKLGWKAMIEPHLRNSKGELRKPDIIFIKGDTAVVVDVTVRWEDNAGSLEQAHSEKVAYYLELEEEIKNLTGGKNIHFFGFVLGARGKWSEGNNDLLQLLGMDRSKNFKESICRLVLYSTIGMMAIFSDR
ncbi:cGMP-inhibited 3',5'-cyclic phosphodiesterase 3B isoform X1 [Chrysemys picta bellii]|uniref:cGMP-inhibited 3',5'-cyclic phosphodiesterase 3B isoform X1 n=1 Tax=Chrysemys picta bellii TaxID=8478 RepID=UPI0032B2F709